jgi:hypothetical protein
VVLRSALAELSDEALEKFKFSGGLLMGAAVFLFRAVLKGLAVVATGEFEKRKQIGHAEDIFDLFVGVNYLQLAAASSGGNVKSGNGAQAGAVNHRNFFHVQDDLLVKRNQGANFFFQKRGILAGEFAVAFDHHPTVDFMRVDAESGWGIGSV